MFSKQETSKKMALTLLFFLSWLCVSPLASAFDITHILGQHPGLTTFSNYLTQTQLTHDINSRQSITLLAVTNSDLAPISGKPIDQIKKIMAVHVLLGYYDLARLKKLKGSTLTVPTLLHSNSINITIASGGTVVFGSARSQLVRTVESDPYTISVLQINSPIIPRGEFSTPRHSRRALAESPVHSPSQNDDHKQAPSQNKDHKHASPPPPPPPPPPSNSHSNKSAPPPSNPDNNNKNAPQPSDSNSNSSPPPPPPSKKSSPPPPPQDDNANSPDSNDSNKNKDSPPSSSPPKGDAPSSGPTSDSPSPAPGDEDTPDADDEGNNKNSAGGLSPSSTGWIGAVIISVILVKMI